MESLPDDVLVHIGAEVADLCGVRDFARLGSASKGLRSLLLGSKESVSHVLNTGADRVVADAMAKEDELYGINNNSNSNSNSNKNGKGKSRTRRTMIRPQSLEQLALCESAMKHNLQQANFNWRKTAGRFSRAKLVGVLQKILSENPSAYLVVETFSEYQFEDQMKEWVRENFDDTVVFRSWGKKQLSATNNGENQNNNNHNDNDGVNCVKQTGRAYVDFFVQMESPDPSQPPLDFPPREVYC